MDERVPAPFTSAAAMFAFDADLRIVCWNDAAARLTGIPSREAVGRACWDVIAGEDDRGGIVCHKGCSRARLLRQGWCVPMAELHARAGDGRRRISLETIAAHGEGGPLFVHVMRDAPAPQAEPRATPTGPSPRLTPRQREILGLLAAGHSVKTVARELGLRETTVRNHLRLLFVELDVHSQREAVARARFYGIV